jgi:hypothetical protein
MEKVYHAKSVIISRKPGKDKEGLKNAFLGFFTENNPHLKGKAAAEVVEIPEVEKVRIRELRNVSYYLMGNDIVINNLVEVRLVKEGNILTLTGKQNLPK